MRVRFWGTRGSIASPGLETLRYGGNTPCVEARADDGTLLVFDCGTGARKLGLSLAARGPARVHLFVGHTHADHIQGLPFFVPAFMAGSHITIYGPAGLDLSLPTAVGGQMDYAYFPLPLHDLPAQIDFVEIGETEFTIGAVSVRTQYLNHTAPCLGYRIEVGGAVLVYSTDHEPHTANLWRPDRLPGTFDPAAMLHPSDARHCDFLEDADLVVHDSQYAAAEYPAKMGWGHSPVEYAVDVALTARARQLALFHHDPERTDEQVDAMLRRSQEYVQHWERKLDVIAAAEGGEVVLQEHLHANQAMHEPSAPHLPRHAHVLVAEDDDEVAALLEGTLQHDGYTVERVRAGLEAVNLAGGAEFDLVFLGLSLPGLDGLEVCRRLRADHRYAGTPIVMLTHSTDEETIMAGFSAGVTDYMAKPFAVAQIRARVRSWLERSSPLAGAR